MKIEFVQYIDHKVLGNLRLDFSVNGMPSSTVFLAGENGVGKTSILNSLNKLSVLNPAHVQPGDGMLFGLILTQDQRASISIHSSARIPEGKIIGEKATLELIPDAPLNLNRYQLKVSVDGVEMILGANILSEALFQGSFRTLYSNVAINFTPKQIKSVTSKNVDESNISATTDQNIATEITQLLIDVQALDDADLSSWVRQNLGEPVPDHLLDKRISRFRAAFATMFPSKEYKEIRNHENSKKVVFSMGGKECFIEDLSSGEKQIVFRGGFFLQDSKKDSSVIALLDEPEISMHPSWQLKIMDFYKSILGVEFRDSKCQLFVATHSPFVLHNYNRSDDKIIVLNIESNEICVSDSPTFFGWKPEEAIEDAFNISVNPDIQTLLVLVEGETDERYLVAAANELGIDISGIDVRWVGRINESGNAEFTGDRALNQTFSFLIANPNVTSREVLLLYDSDTNKPEYEGGKLSIKTMPRMEGRKAKRGIENLLRITDDFDFSQFTDEQEKTDEYDITTTVRKLNKMRLCDHIINNIQMYPDIFEDFIPLFDLINRV